MQSSNTKYFLIQFTKYWSFRLKYEYISSVVQIFKSLGPIIYLIDGKFPPRHKNQILPEKSKCGRSLVDWGFPLKKCQ